jgi:hypothetical protein
MLPYLFIDDEGILPALTSKHSVVYTFINLVFCYFIWAYVSPEILLSSRSKAHFIFQHCRAENQTINVLRNGWAESVVPIARLVLAHVRAQGMTRVSGSGQHNEGLPVVEEGGAASGVTYR